MARVKAEAVAVAPRKRIVARVGDGDWIESFDLEAHEGRGRIVLTHDKKAALVMDRAEWLAAYMESPRCRPLRDDGAPNRPLTGIPLLTFEPAED